MNGLFLNPESRFYIIYYKYKNLELVTNDWKFVSKGKKVKYYGFCKSISKTDLISIVLFKIVSVAQF